MDVLKNIPVVLCVLAITYAAPLKTPMLQELDDCVNSLSPSANTTFTKASVPRLETPEDVQRYCIQQLVWKVDMVRWEDYNITKTDMDFVNGLLESMMVPTGAKHLRSKRQLPLVKNELPPSGFRIRREYRSMSDQERNAFHTVLNTMKTNGQYDTFANLHQGVVLKSAHGGPNFLGWHRVFLALFEEAMRRIDRNVSLPYWDSTLDFYMVEEEDTIMFSTSFLGSEYGQVINGPFANWTTPTGTLRRFCEGNGTLFSKEMIAMIMTRCRTREIIKPNALHDFDIERLHGGIHSWVGGHMSRIARSAHDPIFFLHHAFVDYIWEMFRHHQYFDCRVDPNLDYPEDTGVPEHAPNNSMDGFPGYANIDGYRSYWTQHWYKYERSPGCPLCNNSPYLRCDKTHNRCVSLPDSVIEAEMNISDIFDEQFIKLDSGELIDLGPEFDSPPPDPRTREGKAILARQQTVIPEEQSKMVSGIILGESINRAARDVNSGNAFPAAQPMPLLSITVSDTLHSNMQYPRSYNTNLSVSDWLFVPFQLTYTVGGADNYAQTPKCLPTSAIWTHVNVSAQGLNYLGEYTDNEVMDTSKALPSAHAIIVIRAPVVGPSIAMVTASHECGLMCKPMCINTATGLSQYTPCSGILWIKPEDATAYARSHEKAAESIQRYDAKIPILFQCHKESESP